jgi:RNA polymerase sigma-70 factor (ECF subfamily)
MRADERQAAEVDEAEAELVREMLAGSEAAFDRFAADYVPPLWRFAIRRLGDRELTGDIVQSTTVKAIAKLEQFRGDSALATWLCAICAREIADHFRRRARAGAEVELDEGSLAAGGAGAEAGREPEVELLARERDQLVHEALDALPQRYARALEWMYLERVPVREIAARLEIGPKAAESLLTRSRDAFRFVYRRLTELPDRGRRGALVEGAER